MKRLLLALVMVVMVSPAWGADQFQSGSQLYGECKNEASPASYGFCYGYILATFDAMVENDDELHGWIACLEENHSGKQVRDVVVKWLTDHPTRRYLSSSWIIARALSEAFPCQ